jgi:hypothetical protein
VGVLGGCGLAVVGGITGWSLAQVGPAEGPFPPRIPLDVLGDLGLTFEIAGYSEASGWSVDAAGDFNGDGLDDVVIGAPGSYMGGGALVVFGRRDAGASIDLGALDGTDGFRAIGPEGNFVGRAVAGVGDINGDGFDDVAIGGPDPWGFREAYLAGVVYILFGRDAASGPFPASIDLAALDGTDGFRLDGEAEEDRAGAALAGVGDINGDGYDDVLIGAPEVITDGRHADGLGYVLYGRDATANPFPAAMSLGDLDGSSGFRMSNYSGGDRLGSVVDGIGDFNGDGRPDVAISGPNWTVGADEFIGITHVVFGRDAAGEPFPESLDLRALDGTDGVSFRGGDFVGMSGTGMAGAGDANGDGVDDLLIGVPWGGPTISRTRSGLTYLVFGRPVADVGPFAPVVDLEGFDGRDGVLIIGLVDSMSGSAIAHAGDLNGDGLADIFVGAPKFGDGPRPLGGGFVLMGRRDPWPAFLNLFDPAELDGRVGFSFTGARYTEGTGLAIAGAGDFNADGAPDLLIGSRNDFDPGHTSLIFGRVPCAADLDLDGLLTIYDFLTFQNLFDAGDARADLDRDGAFTLLDFLAFQNAFDAGCG